jgi:uncharacterized membrane protein
VESANTEAAFAILIFMTIKPFTSALVSITALRIYLGLVILLSAWNLYQLLSIPFAVLAQTGFTPVDYALYFVSALSMLSTVLGFAYVAYTPKSLATDNHALLMQILGTIAVIWAVADLLSTVIYMIEVTPGGAAYWYQLANGFLMSFINPIIVCEFVLYILERYAARERAPKIGAIVLWSVAAWVFLITLGVIIGAMVPGPQETA